METILQGILTGLLLSSLIGATFFMLIETSMTRGFRAAIWFDLGVVLSDAVMICGTYYFASWITNTIIHSEFFSITGGIAFMAFGVNYLFTRRKPEPETIKMNRNIRLFMNGFFINLMNPSVILFWLGSVAFSLNTFKHNGQETFIYYLAALMVMASIDILKAYFAFRLSGLIHSNLLRMFYVFSGILLIGLGLWFIFG